MEKLGIFATEEEIMILKDAINAPYIKIGNHFPEDPRVICHRFALQHGLPEISGYYGIIPTGEFVKSE